MNFSRIITPSLPRQWRICICCALIYILLCMLHFYGVTSVLQALSFCLPSVTFETFDFIVVPRQSRFLFHSSSLLRGMIIHDFSQRGVVLCCHRLNVTCVFITSWLIVYRQDCSMSFLNFSTSNCLYFDTLWFPWMCLAFLAFNWQTTNVWSDV